MPTIAYQSFNANSSSNHSLAATSLQRFTRDTNAHVTGQDHKALVLPTVPKEGGITSPVYGPAHLKPIERLGSTQAVSVFGAQIALLWQNFYRQFGGMPDIMVCGEMDMSHPDFTGLVVDEQREDRKLRRHQGLPVLHRYQPGAAGLQGRDAR